MNFSTVEKRLKKIEAQLALSAAGSPGGSDNWIFQSSVPAAQTQTNAQKVSIGAVALQAKYSGMFYASIRCGWTASVTAEKESFEFTVVDYLANPASRFTGGDGSKVIAANGVTTTLAIGSNWGQSLNADAAGSTASGVEFAGVAPISSAAHAQTQIHTDQLTLTNLNLTADGGETETTYSGFVPAVSPKKPFTIGHTIVFSWVLVATNGGEVVTFTDLELSVWEAAA